MYEKDLIKQIVEFIEQGHKRDLAEEAEIEITSFTDGIDLEEIADEVVEVMSNWQKEHHNYYKTSEIFWKEFFKELKEQLI